MINIKKTSHAMEKRILLVLSQSLVTNDSRIESNVGLCVSLFCMSGCSHATSSLEGLLNASLKGKNICVYSRDWDISQAVD